MRALLVALVLAGGSASAEPIAPANPDCFCAAVPTDGVRVVYLGAVHAGTEGTVLTVEDEICGGECGVHPAGTDITLGEGTFVAGSSVAFQVDGAWVVVPHDGSGFVQRFASETLATDCYRPVAILDAVDFILNHDCTAAAEQYFETDAPQAASNEGCAAAGSPALLGHTLALTLLLARTRRYSAPVE